MFARDPKLRIIGASVPMGRGFPSPHPIVTAIPVTAPARTPAPNPAIVYDQTKWDDLAAKLHIIDESRIKSWNAAIDTLLVLAGLFSAILTAFTVESYKFLQQDSGDTTIIALAQISLQLKTLQNNNGSDSSSPPAFSIPTFHPPGSAIRINTLWFASLVLSLIAASLGMLVKQWLREYLSGDFASPWDQIRLRHHRYRNLLAWKVFEIAAIPQMLLQFSLILFLIGLSDFLRQLNVVVGGVITALISLWLLLFTISVISPIISPQCPYKSPLLNDISGKVRSILSTYTQLPNRQYEKEIRRNSEDDIKVLAYVDKYLGDDRVLNVIIYPCLRSLPWNIPDVLFFMKKTLLNRLSSSFSPNAPITFWNVQELELNRLTKTALSTLTNIAFDLLSFQCSGNWEDSEHDKIGYLRETVVSLMALIATGTTYSSKQMRGGLNGSSRTAVGLVEGQSRLINSRRPDLVAECIGAMSFYGDIPIGDVRVGGAADLALIIQVVRKLSDARERVPILGLCRVVLSLLVENVNRLSTTSYAEQQSIRRLLSYMARKLAVLSPYEPERHSRAQNCLELCISLDNQIPGLVSSTLIANLQGLSSLSIRPT